MKEHKITQYERVYRHLQDYGSLTSWEAFMDYGITRLAAIIFLMRKKGWRITTKFVTNKNRYNETVSFAEYSWE